MKLGIMQPYLFPYIGYFQLISAVDLFVIYDDVNFIKQGWINRNRILMNRREHLFSLRLRDASSFRPINETFIGDNGPKLLKTFRQAYMKAPCFHQAEPLIRKIFENPEKNLARFVSNSITEVCHYLGITTKIVISSEIPKDNSLKGEEKIIDICKLLGASQYINAIGGQELYSSENFAKANITLNFIKSLPIVYDQDSPSFIPWLSIIDIIMFNHTSKINDFLNQWELI